MRIVRSLTLLFSIVLMSGLAIIPAIAQDSSEVPDRLCRT